ncbi:MAG: EcsC family protein [Burkholderiales bacterium]|nr:EcsC family protein [Burkholderiales bacterium]
MSDESSLPALLKAVLYALATPESLRRYTRELQEDLRLQHPDKTTCEIRALAADKIISQTCYCCAAVGCVAALPGVIPGVGTLTSVLGGGAADLTACVKFQAEMAMKLADLHGYNLVETDVQLLCLFLAGVGKLNESAMERAKTAGTLAVIALLKENLKGALLQAVKTVFTKLGIAFSRTSVLKALPFFIGSVAGAGTNFQLTRVVGRRINTTFATNTLPSGYTTCVALLT